jgi:hypothetical protein
VCFFLLTMSQPPSPPRRSLQAARAEPAVLAETPLLPLRLPRRRSSALPAGRAVARTAAAGSFPSSPALSFSSPLLSLVPVMAMVVLLVVLLGFGVTGGWI